MWELLPHLFMATKMPNERECYAGIVKRGLKEEWCGYLKAEYVFSMLRKRGCMNYGFSGSQYHIKSWRFHLDFLKRKFKCIRRYPLPSRS
jgi:hypothetical protein